MRTTVIGVFADDDAAMAAAERVREAASPGTNVRTLVAGKKGPVATGVTWDRSDWRRVLLLGWVMGLVFAVAFAFARLSWVYSVVGLVTGAAMGAMLALWLTGENFGRLPAGTNGQFKRLMHGSQALVVVDIADAVDLPSLSRVLHDSGGQVYEERPHTVGGEQPIL